MGTIYRFLASYEPLIYILLAIGGLFAFRRMIQAWVEWRNAVYGLEREFALRRLGQSTALGVLVLFLMFGEFFVATFMVPGLPASGFLATPTIDVLASPLGGITPAPGTEAAPPLVLPAASGNTTGCIADQLIITSPKSGDEVKKIVELIGTVDIPNFGFYKYEVAPYGTDNWATVSAGDKPQRKARLGYWDTTALSNGDYQLRLIAVDNVGESLPPCIITLRVVNQ